jgi:DNA end-binding protein Ku
LKKTEKVGLGSFVLRNRESLVIVRPTEDILLLNKIRFAEEIRDASEIKVPQSDPKPNELKMAVQLINQLTTEFDISKYKDTYSEKLLKVIHDKAKGKKVTAAPLRVVHSRGRDLMEQLKASLESSPKKKAS